MKVACPKCKRYYTLDQDVTCIVEVRGTVATCTLCGTMSMFHILEIPSNSVARRIAVQEKEVKSEEGG